MASKKKILSKKSAIQIELEEKQLVYVDAGFRIFPILFTNTLVGDHGNKLDGLTTFSPALIQIDADQNEEGIRETLIHEIFHIIAAITGLDPDDESEIRIKNEDLILQFSRGTMIIQRLNRELWDILFKES